MMLIETFSSPAYSVLAGNVQQWLYEHQECEIISVQFEYGQSVWTCFVVWRAVWRR